MRAAKASRLIDEGDVVDLGDRHFEVLHLPGHSPGSIALWEPRTATLFAGDVVYDGALYDQLYHSDPAAYRTSLERLRALPVETVHGGHFESFGRPRMIELIDRYLGAAADPRFPKFLLLQEEAAELLGIQP